ncbi:MAG: anaerobic glycerol-3-phosphate dehydrogenase subunit C [Spirochaetes bacterium]|nr:anaerobic glycerol-3-phosphate dehydrogenase subunit C [Spirochaetota bacterium]
MIKLQNISFDHCIKCTICNVYCPVARVSLFPGPKQSGPDTERFRIKSPELVDSTLKLCSNCKRCEIACPSNVKIADIIQEAKWKYLKRRWFRPRDLILSRTDLMGKFATLFNSIVNFFTRRSIVKFFLYLFIGIPYQKTLPEYENGTFEKHFYKNYPDQNKFPDHVVFFHGCFVNYNNHKLGRDLVKVLNSLNVGVNLVKEKCCGVPLIANGYINKAKKNAQYNINSLSEIHEKSNFKIVSTSSSCTYALKNEYSNLLNLDNSAISNEIEYITKFIYDRFESGNIFKMKPVPLRAAYHSPCHLERLGGVIYTIDLLKRIPGLDLVILHSECCGIAGTYGFKKEYYKLSQDIGKDLFRSIETANPEIVITDCETCALQIEMNTQFKVLHPVNILAMAVKE